MRWASWLANVRQHDLEGRRRVRIALLCAIVVAAGIASLYGAPW